MKFTNTLLLLTAGFISVGLMAGQTHVAFAAPRAATAAVTVDDKTLEGRIDAAMKKDATLANQTVDVDVQKGIATLTGSVRSSARKARAGRHANIVGVTRVDKSTQGRCERRKERAREGRGRHQRRGQGYGPRRKGCRRED